MTDVVSCAIAGCERTKIYAHGWCEKHYKRWLKHGDPAKTLQSDLKGTVCSATGCERPSRKVFLCNSHYTKQWQKNNPTRSKQIRGRAHYRRSARRRGFQVKHTHQEWLALLEQFEGICAYCRKNKATTRDHVVPISKNGTDTIDNILPACRSCNARKNAMSLEKFIKKLVIEDYGGEYNFNHVLINSGVAKYNGKIYDGNE